MQQEIVPGAKGAAQAQEAAVLDFGTDDIPAAEGVVTRGADWIFHGEVFRCGRWKRWAVSCRISPSNRRRSAEDRQNGRHRRLRSMTMLRGRYSILGIDTGAERHANEIFIHSTFSSGLFEARSH